MPGPASTPENEPAATVEPGLAWEALLGRVRVVELLASGPPAAQALLEKQPASGFPDLWYAAFREADDPEPVGMGLATNLDDAKRECERILRELGEHADGGLVLPERLRINDERMAGWFSPIEARGVRVEVRANPADAWSLDLLVRGMLLRQLLGEPGLDDDAGAPAPTCPMTSGHGVRDEHVRSFHQAAAAFAKAAPWRWFPPDSFVEVVRPKPPAGMRLFSIHRDGDGAALHFVKNAKQAAAIAAERTDEDLLGHLNDGLWAMDLLPIDEALPVDLELFQRLGLGPIDIDGTPGPATLVQLSATSTPRVSRQRLAFVTALLHAVALQTAGILSNPEGTRVPLEIDGVPGVDGGRFVLRPTHAG